ncbi:MAG TPA: DUF924 family protein [Methylomirabilota bacterium]|nr:DUF924 family protein [Methylomirabilota bacterium]
MSSAEEILTFWFGDLRDDEAYYEERRKLWFASDPRIDQDIKNRFLSNYEHAVAGQLQRWRDTPRTTLALILLFDQFPRNMFRGDPQAFATDAQARALTLDLIQTGADVQLHPVERMFVYMPLMHSEDLTHQRQAVTLFRQLAQDNPRVNAVSYAERHLEIIERFGRFPHRNAILGRSSTPEELDFLRQPGSSF